MTERIGSNKIIYIVLGIIIGLLTAISIYFYIETHDLRTLVEIQQAQTDSLKSLKPIIESVSNESVDDNLIQTEENKSKSKEEMLWNATQKINTFDAYLEFIKSDENSGVYQSKTIERLFALGTSGWLYSGRTDIGVEYSDDQLVEVLWRKNVSSEIQNSLPKIGDIVILKSQQARRTYPDFLPRTNQNGIWSIGKLAYVIDTRMEGKTAVIIKVVY